MYVHMVHIQKKQPALMQQKQHMEDGKAEGLAAGEPLEDYTKFNTTTTQTADASKGAKVSMTNTAVNGSLNPMARLTLPTGQ